MRAKMNRDVTYPLRKVSQEAREHVEQRHEVRVERHVDHSRVLFVEGRNDRLRDIYRCQAREEEPVEEGLGVARRREERGHDVSCNEQRRPDARGVVDVVEFVTERLM